MLKLFLLPFFLSCITALPINHQHEKRQEIYATVTQNGMVETWSWSTSFLGATAGANTDSTSTRTHYVTSTIKKSNKKKRDMVYATVTQNGVVETWSWITNEGAVAATTLATTTKAAPAITAAATSAAVVNKAVSKLSSSSGSSLSAFQKVTDEFQDGVHSCDDFPSDQQGVVSVSWAGYGGWTSLQSPTDGSAPSSGKCQDGYYCSYACQPGMSKTQWPSSQPANGVSLGGLICKSGKLYRSNTASTALCTWGTETAYAVSKLDKTVALCRTDYPGSENMIIPTELTAGGKQPMSVVDEKNYYKWQGKATSAQYYVNNAGVSVKDGCVWGTEGSGKGNWAPVVIGSGTDTNGKTWLSVFPNPNNSAKPNYVVSIEGDNISGSCSYPDKNPTGCTVQVLSGIANFKFKNA